MCNLNYISKKRKITENDKAVIEMITQRSYEHNNDGEGYYTEQKEHNTNPENKIFITKENISKQNKWILFHERLATHGKKDKINTQPLITDKIVLAHNGVIFDDIKDDYSDSYRLTKEINDKYETSLIKAIKEIIPTKYGSLSIFIIDKITNKVYYYKNERTYMYYTKNNNLILMSTKKENVELAKEYYGTQEVKEVEDNYLYEIKKNKIVKICELKSKEYVFKEETKDELKIQTINETIKTYPERETDIFRTGPLTCVFHTKYPIHIYNANCTCKVTMCVYCKETAEEHKPDCKLYKDSIEKCPTCCNTKFKHSRKCLEINKKYLLQKTLEQSIKNNDMTEVLEKIQLNCDLWGILINRFSIMTELIEIEIDDDEKDDETYYTGKELIHLLSTYGAIRQIKTLHKRHEIVCKMAELLAALEEFSLTQGIDIDSEYEEMHTNTTKYTPNMNSMYDRYAYDKC